MSDDSRKKLHEIEILKKVFGVSTSMIQESEQPDFILNYNQYTKFGVEVTDLYYDGTSARLKKGGYINQLLQEQKYLHKEDKKKIKVAEIAYFSRELKYKPTKMPALFPPKYTIHQYLSTLEQTIESKDRKLKKYSKDVSDFCMLIINDCERQFKATSEKDVAKNLFSMGLINSIRNSSFYEIYLITDIKGEEKFIPLKSYLLVSDCHLFFDFIGKHQLGNQLAETYVHPMFGFAEIIKRRCNSKVFVGEVANNEVIGNTVIYIGRYGLGMTLQSDDNWGVGVFDTFPLQIIDHAAEFVLDKADFFDDTLFQKYEKETQNIIASIGFNFHVNQ